MSNTLRNIGLWHNADFEKSMDESRRKVHEAMLALDKQKRRIDYLQAMLPDWAIQPYGKTGAIVCYPFKGWNTDASNQDALRNVAPIIGIVSGNGLVVGQLQTEPVGSGPHPLAVF